MSSRQLLTCRFGRRRQFWRTSDTGPWPHLRVDVVIKLTLEVGLTDGRLALKVRGGGHLERDVRSEVRLAHLTLEVTGHDRGQDVALGGGVGGQH